MWWREDALLAVAMDESTGCETILQLLLLADRDNEAVKIQLG